MTSAAICKSRQNIDLYMDFYGFSVSSLYVQSFGRIYVSSLSIIWYSDAFTACPEKCICLGYILILASLTRFQFVVVFATLKNDNAIKLGSHIINIWIMQGAANKILTALGHSFVVEMFYFNKYDI